MGHAITATRPSYQPTHINNLEAYRINGHQPTVWRLAYQWNHVDVVLSAESRAESRQFPLAFRDAAAAKMRRCLAVR